MPRPSTSRHSESSHKADRRLLLREELDYSLLLGGEPSAGTSAFPATAPPPPSPPSPRGDIVAVARYARDIVTAQMFITLIVLAAAIRGVTSAAQLGSHRRGDGGEGGGGAGAGADVAESVETTGSDSASPSGSD
jgi:hypothetical protein